MPTVSEIIEVMGKDFVGECGAELDWRVDQPMVFPGNRHHYNNGVPTIAFTINQPTKEDVNSGRPKVLICPFMDAGEMPWAVMFLFSKDPRRSMARVLNKWWPEGFGRTCVEGVWFGSNIDIGMNVHIGPGSVIGLGGFGYVKEEDGTWLRFPQIGGVVIGDNVDIGANCCIDRGTLGDTIIEDGCKIDNLVHIGHNCHIKKNSIIIAHTQIGGGSVVGPNAWLAPSCTTRDKLVIGEGSTIGLGAVVTKNVEAGAVVYGNPARTKEEQRPKLELRPLKDVPENAWVTTSGKMFTVPPKDGSPADIARTLWPMDDGRSVEVTTKSYTTGCFKPIDEEIEFSPTGYRRLLETALKAGYQFCPFTEDDPVGPTIWLRHDIDYSLEYALAMAKIEKEMGVKSTWFVMPNNPFYSLDDGVPDEFPWVGLHYDRETAKEVPYNVYLSLPGDINKRVEAVSFHNPTEADMRYSCAFGINVYQFMEPKCHYVSDSNMRFREEGLLQHIRNVSWPRLHLLIHPLWWMAEGKDVKSILAPLRQAKIEALDKYLNGNDVWRGSRVYG